MEYILLTICWSLWCFFHSLLITLFVTNYLKNKLQESYIYFRICYNIFALFSFISVWLYAHSLENEIIYQPNGLLFILQAVIFIVSILFFILGTKNYDMKQFIGISQLSKKNSQVGIGRFGEFNQSGILQYTRHPWYLATILILWTGYETLSVTRLIMNIVFTVYVIIGTFLEERKMVAEFGEKYKEYKKKVPMFFPWKLNRL